MLTPMAKVKGQEVYQDLERGSYQESRKSKITRVNRVYNLFNELSSIEQENFINLIKNKIRY